MKRMILLISLAALGSTAWSQDALNDIDEALQLASEKNQHVLMIFSGSDWCKPCIHLRESVLKSQAFDDFSATRLVLLELDFPYKKSNRLSEAQTRHNEALADEFNRQGSFPKVLLLNAQRQVLGEIMHRKNGSVEDFLGQIRQLLNKGEGRL